jgi:GDP-4-dehydro-6-deoxy-D-mannose reductase
MRVLITGVNGFIGSHLAEMLVKKGFDVYGTIYDKNNKNLAAVKDSVKLFDLDINDRAAVEDVIKKIMPDYIFHLAAQAYVMPSWEDMESTLKTNVFGTLYILDAVRKFKLKPSIVVACSSAEYGLSHENEIPIKETREFRPSSPYAVSKVTTDMVSYLYFRAYNLKIIRARLFNTIGPRKKGSAVSDFAMMIAEVESGKRKTVDVGNLNGVIDFTDVRDCINALLLLADKGDYGEAYNICSGQGYKLKDVLEKMVQLSGSKIEIREDLEKVRPLEDPIFVGDNSKLRRLGWAPTISLEKTIRDSLDYWRNETGSAILSK